MTERVIAIDVGAGTADIVVWEAGVPPENSVKLVVPSQTRVVAARIAAATRSRAAVLFTGPTMGGGADMRAMKAHTAAGLPFLATQEAARSFADDLDRVRAHGVTIVDDDEAGELAARDALPAGLPGAPAGALELAVVPSGDIDAAALLDALRRLGVDTCFTGAAVAVQDHGFCPGSSNRVFRFTVWERAVRERRALHDLFYWRADEKAAGAAGTAAEPGGVAEPVSESAGVAGTAGEPVAGPPTIPPVATPEGIPPALTRMRAAAGCAAALMPAEETGAAAGPRILAGDTGPAALLGALTDLDEASTGSAAAPGALAGPHSRPAPDAVTVLVNVGNGHTIAAVARGDRVAGVYEHHTGLLDAAKLESHIRRFLAGELTGDEVRADGGHGAVLDEPVVTAEPLLATGPNRALLNATALPVRFAAPWGDMMIAGCVGLLEAYRTLQK